MRPLFLINKNSDAYWKTLQHVFLFFFILFFCYNEPISAQQFETPFINYTIKNGLVQNQVLDICQDQKGYIWFATTGGISRFDGKQFKNYTVSEGLPNNYVTSLLVDNRNQLWISTNGGGIAVFDGYKFHTYNKDNGLASNYITINDYQDILLEDSNGNIWCRSENGVYKINNKRQVETYSIDNGLVSNTVICIKEDNKGNIWCGTTKGISVIGKDSIINYTMKHGLPDTIVTSILSDENHNIWLVCQNHSIAHFENQEFTKIHLSEPNDFLTAIMDGDNNLWIGNYKHGLYKYNGESFQNIIKDITVTYIHEDRNHNLWFNDFENGIYKYHDEKLTHYTNKFGLIDNKISKIFEDSEGNLWFGTQNGVSMYGKVIFEIITTKAGLPNNKITSVAVDNDLVWCSPQGPGIVKVSDTKIDYYNNKAQEFICIAPASNNRLLLGGNGTGLGWFKNNKFGYLADPSLSNYIYDIQYINDDNYWLATLSGLVHFKNGKTTQYTTKDGLIGNIIYALALDSKNQLWCATAAGLSVFNEGKFTNYKTENGLPNESCIDVAVDKYGTIWLATDDGLCKIKESGIGFEFKTYTTQNGLASNSPYLVHANNSDKLWIGHVNGLNSLDLLTDSVIYYGEADGFTPLECYMGSVATDKQDNIWLGTIGGLVRYNPKADITRKDPPKTYITSISLQSGDDISNYADSINPKTNLPVKLLLPHNQNMILIEWIGIHYTVPSKNRYRYILEGYDNTWHEQSTETFKEYKLSSGRYTFKVMACNNDGVWNTEPVSYSFIVTPPWWESIPAFIGYIILLLFLVFLYVRWRERALIKKNRVLEQKVQERTIEIEKQKKDIEVANEALELYQAELIVQRDKAAEQRDRITEQRTEILDSIHYAKRIQTAIMPQPEDLNAIINAHTLFFRPRNVVSGDFYWATKKDKFSIVVVADCTGHGVPGAFLSMLGISLLTEIVLKQEVIEAAEILNELRANLKTILSQTGKSGEQRDGMDVALCIINYETMEMQYAGAYNSLYLIRESELIEYKANKMPVGIHVGIEKKFQNHVIELKNNDMIYIFTDGYIDQFGGENNSKFKSKPFKQLLIDISPLDTNRQKEILVTTHDQWKGDCFQVDDILVMGIRINNETLDTR